MEVIGLDVATDPGRTGIAVGRWTRAPGEGALVLRQVAGRCTSAELAEMVRAAVRPTLLAVDAPLGWPAVLGDELRRHRAGAPLQTPRSGLFSRATDRFVHRTLGKKPLDVGADRIAYTAHRALELLAEVGAACGGCPLAWGEDQVSSVAAIEVYPAATLTALGVAHRGYKDDPALRAQVLRDLPGVEVPDELRAACVATSDALDAVVAALAGVHFLEGRCHQPAEDPELLRREGWIWVLAPS